MLKALLTLSVLAPTSLALGINCRGSLMCNFKDCGYDAIDKIHGLLDLAIKKGLGDIVYDSGERIACHWQCCAYYQNGASGTVKQIMSHVQNIQAHGCRGCGSDPIQPGGDVLYGQLTVGYVGDKTRCEEGHLCPLFLPDTKIGPHEKVHDPGNEVIPNSCLDPADDCFGYGEDGWIWGNDPKR